MTKPVNYSVIRLSRDQFRNRIRASIGVYLNAMGYRSSLADGRADAWLAQQGEPNWTAVAAFAHPTDLDVSHIADDPRADLVGIGFCFSGNSRQWWNQQVHAGLARHGTSPRRIRSLLNHYVELSELHVLPEHQGAHLGEDMLRLMLEGRPERIVLLSTPEVPDEENRAWSLYRRTGFCDVLRDFHFPGDPRPFAVLGSALPLPPVRQSGLTLKAP